MFRPTVKTSKSYVFFNVMQGPEVRSGDVPQPITLKEGQEFNFTIKRGVSTEDTVSVNYDDFINDVEAGDMLLVDGR
jgi:pyruvate kinase